jgi:hypothetical protein
MTEKVFALDTQPGIQRDGTVFDKSFYSDGQWVRFQRGRPRKMLGYSQITNLLAGPSRGIFQDSTSGLSRIYSGFENGLQVVALNNVGVGSSTNDFTFGGKILTLSSIISGGTNYTNGTYKNIPLTTTTGIGSGATANMTVSGNAVTSVTLTNGGNGYAYLDTLSVAPSSIGNGINTTSSLVGGTLYGNGTYLAVPLIYGTGSPSTGGLGSGATANITVAGNTVTSVAIQKSGIGYTVGDVLTCSSNFIGGGSGIISSYGGLVGGQYYTSGTYTNVAFTGGSGSGARGTVTVGTNSIESVYNIVSGGNYTNGSFTSVPLTGGSGTGATAIITVSGGNVIDVTIEFGGNNYAANDVLSADAAKIGNGIATISVTAIGTGYPDGIYSNVPLTNTVGTGSLALATITISGGAVVACSVSYAGIGYAVTDTLTASNTNLGGAGTGFQAQPATISTSTGFQCQVSSVITGSVTKVVLTSDGLGYAAGDILSVPADDIGIKRGIIGSLGGITGGSFYTSSTSGTGTGTIAGTVMTITAMSDGSFVVGQTITGTGVSPDTTITAYGTPTATLAGVAFASITGDFTCTATTLAVGNTVTISGTGAGGQITSPLYVNPTSYLISDTNGTTTFKLTTLTGAAIVTTIGASTGRTFKLFGGTGSYNVSKSQTVTSTTLAGLGIFRNKALTGGTGSGATANVTITSGVVTNVTLVNPGVNYAVGDNLTASFAGVTNGVGSGTALVGGTLYTDGTFASVPLTGGSGAGAVATITVSGNTVVGVALTSPGTGYTVGNALSCSAALIGNGVNSNVITTAGSNYPDGTYTDIPLTGGSGKLATGNITVTVGAVTAFTINNRGVGYTVGNTLSFAASSIGGYTNGINTFGAITAGSNYTNGVWTDVPLTGGAGTGATAQITVAGNVVTAITITNKGNNYVVANSMSCLARYIGNGINTKGTTSGGSGYTGNGIATNGVITGGNTYTNGTYAGIPLTTLTGSGTAAVATIVVAGNSVTSVTYVNPEDRGYGYAVGDQLSAPASLIGGTGTGFSFLVGTVGAATFVDVPLIGGTGSLATADIVVNGGKVTTVTMVDRGIGYANGNLMSANASDIGGTGSGFSFPVTAIYASTGFAVPVATVVTSSGFTSVLTAPFASSGFTFNVATLGSAGGFSVPVTSVLTSNGFQFAVLATTASSGFQFNVGSIYASSGFSIAVDSAENNFVPSVNNLWQLDTLYNVAGGVNSILAHPGQNLDQIDNTVNTNVFYGPVTSTTVSPLKDTGGANPTNNFITVSGGVVALHPYVFVYGNAGLIKNCSAGDPTDWNSADANEVNVAAGKIIKGLPVRGGSNSPSGLFWSLDSLIRVSYIGGVGTPPQYWRYDIISSQSSIMSSQCVIEYDGIYYWIGTDRFLMYNGVVQEIPNNMNQNYFFDNLNYDQRQKVWATKVPRFGEVWWFYPRGDSEECNDAIIYNIREKTWYDAGTALGSQRSAGYFSQVFRYPVISSNVVNATGGMYTVSIASAGAGYTDGVYPYIDAVGGPGVGATLTITVSGGAVTKVVVNNKGTGYTAGNGFTAAIPGSPSSNFAGIVSLTCDFVSLWRHETGTDQVYGVNSNAIESYFETNDIGWVSGGPSQVSPVGENRWLHIERVEPDFIQDGEMSVYIISRPYAQSQDIISSPYPFDPNTNKIDMREQGRELRLRFVSNVTGGDYQVGRVIVNVDFGDVRGY